MSKAEARALEAYPPKMRYVGIDSVKDDRKIDVNKPMRDRYVKAYHQAEKDLRDISWIKEISGVKEMSRAKEEALKAYPPRSIAANYDTINRRDAFEYGYLKAEEDLKLTWEDMREIDKISSKLLLLKGNLDDKGFFQEVLKRFNENRKK